MTSGAWTHRHTCTLRASPAQVFAALTTPQEFPRTVDISDYPFGWASFLNQLKSLVETA